MVPMCFQCFQTVLLGQRIIKIQNQKTSMSEEIARFQQALALPGHSIKQFYSEAPSDLIPNLRGPCPDFFNHNLVSPFRVLKQFTDSPHNNIRLFYFLLLRSTYEVETEEGLNPAFMQAFVQIVFHKEFEIFFTTETQNERDLYNDLQFKKLFAEFVTLLDSDEPTNIERAINSYPIIDTVFIHILRSILASQGINLTFESKIPTATVFGELASLLGFTVTEHGGNCWKFEDSDMFCYEHNDNELYLAYTVDTGNVTSEEASDNPQALAGNFDSGTTQTISVSEMPPPILNIHEPALGIEHLDYKFNETAPLVESNYVSSYAGSQVTGSAAYNAAPLPTYETNFDVNSYKPLTSGSEYIGYTTKLDEFTKPSTTSAEFSYSRADYQVPSYQPAYQPKKYEAPIYEAPIYQPPVYQPPAALPVLTQTFGVSSSSAGAAGWSAANRTVAIAGSGDYLNDFTNDQVVEKMEEPYKSKVIQIKQRVKDWKRPAVGAGLAPTTVASSTSSWGGSFGGGFGAGALTGGYTSSVETVSYSRTIQI